VRLCELDHADAGRIESELRTLGIAPAEEPRLAAQLAELTSGSAETTVAGERWVDSLRP
jgi:hypothetical protein